MRNQDEIEMMPGSRQPERDWIGWVRKRTVDQIAPLSANTAGSAAVAYFGAAGGDTEPVAISPLSIATAPHCLDSAFASNRPSAT